MERIKVLHLFGRMDCGGAETMLMNIYRNIDRNRISFDFLVHSPKRGYYDEEIVKLGGKIYYIESQGSQGLIKYIVNLKKFLKTNSFDIVHSHLDWQGGAIARAAYSAGMKRIIIHSHTYTSYRMNTIYKIVIKLQRYWINKYATDYWACSNEAGKFLFKNNKDIKIIPNAIDLEKYLDPNSNVIAEIKKSLNASNNTIILGHIGSFSPNKNQKFLIQIGRELKVKNIDFRIVMVGNNNSDYANECMSLVTKYNMENYIFLLGLRNDIHNIISAFDILCFPSIFEGLGIVVIEAQAAGIPCIVSEGIPRSVDMGLSLITKISVKNINKWCEEIQRKKTKKTDFRLIREKISYKGFDIKGSVKSVEKMYTC